MSETAYAVFELEHFETLRDRLIKATKDYRQSTDPKLQRLAWIEAQRAMCDFVRELLEPTDKEGIAALQMVDELIAALEDLKEGRQPLTLAPAATRPCRDVPLSAEGDYATAAVAVDFYVDAGMSVKEAAQKVVKVARRIGSSLPPGSRGQRSEADRLIDYRKRIRGRGTSAPDKYRDAKQIQEMLHQFRDDKITDMGKTKREFADYFLNDRWPSLRGARR